MKLSDFDYYLPKELIAQYPLRERDSARLLVLNCKQGLIEHRIFRDIIDYFRRDDLLVLNDTKVLHSRLSGKRLTGGKVEILLLNRKNKLTFNALIKPRRLKLKEKIIFTPPLLQCRGYSGKERAGFNSGKIYAEVTGRNEVTFSTPNIKTIYNQGLIPLPPYIKRPPQELDNIYYQTIYARQAGSIASPTAGLHFTKELITEIRCRGSNIAYITLHIGYSTFKPVKTEDITTHKMDKEYFCMDKETPRLLRQTRINKGRIFAVGTSSVRALETYASLGLKKGLSDLFIYPGYKFNIVDCLLTNFHLPRTTLFMLVCAFGGMRLIKKAYQEAIDKKYRFYSYGDAMLIV